MATTDDNHLIVLEKCHVSPPPNTVGQRSLPLTFFDLGWLLFHPLQQLFFYNFPHPKSHFIDTIIPKLKHSLSITLQHFFPFAGNLLLFPSSSTKPEIRHVDADSIALTFAECDLDFNHLKGNQPRDCNMFHPLVPRLENAFKETDDIVKIPVFSIQVTIFPNSGFTIGLTNHHALCDATTSYDFLMAWTSIARHGTDELFLLSSDQSLPFYDRVIQYPSLLDDMILSLPPIRTIDETYTAPELLPHADKLRFTLVLTLSQINRLKKWVSVQVPSLEVIVSSFAVGCGFAWSCIAKSRVEVLGTEGEYEEERFTCMANWRARLNPPLPPTYFGNCVGPIMATTKTTSIIGDKGFPIAAELLATAIREGVKCKEGVFKDAETWMERFLRDVPTMGVAGTPKLNVYEVDFGWGKPEKYETISIDFGTTLSVNASKESSEGLEIGLWLPAKQMDAFISISKNELENMHSVS
ncbi:hypothetical protein QVD17_33600 [Tagetes erecta]|uniref:Uncharacterized protein n=1 Tax=Tagetes erecta TaxID=13708 RepID=A0AAD8JYZ7_TARER|nr:hypothetical protein QVD17_33600 [Tagetes erecta]